MTELRSPLAEYRSCPEERMDGYVSFVSGNCRVVACEWAAQAIREALEDNTLHGWAAARETRDPLRGRGISYGVTLPAGQEQQSCTPVVVRRNLHGGLLRFLTGEYFLMPTRAPLELAISLRLAGAGVATPEVVSYVIYPCGGILARSDVMTRRLPEGADFPVAWELADVSGREALLRAVAKLLRDLARVGAWHADLNLKNIYCSAQGPVITAHVLDVDRVTFPGGDVMTRNLSRLARSARKWREKWGLDIDRDALERLALLAREVN